MPEMALNVPCPICNYKNLNSNISVVEIPYFGECLQTIILCNKCNYKSVDFMITQQNEPVRYELKINDPEDMMIRVVRSSSSTINIPEIGAFVEPGPNSEGYITNVEGVIDRIQNAITISVNNADEKKKEIANNLLEKIDSIKNGEFEATLIIEDLFGNSAIFSKKANKRVLTEKEVENIKKRM